MFVRSSPPTDDYHTVELESCVCYLASRVESATPSLAWCRGERSRRGDTEMHRDVIMVQVVEFETNCKSRQLAS